LRRSRRCCCSSTQWPNWMRDSSRGWSDCDHRAQRRLT
jgi:hypothetical protein